MNEEITIKSKKNNIVITFINLSILSTLIVSIVSFFLFRQRMEYVENKCWNEWNIFKVEDIEKSDIKNPDKNLCPIVYRTKEFFKQDTKRYYIYTFIILEITFFVIEVIFINRIKNQSITVIKDRIYGLKDSNKEFNILIDEIESIKITYPNVIRIISNNEKLNIYFITNYKEILDEIERNLNTNRINIITDYDEKKVFYGKIMSNKHKLISFLFCFLIFITSNGYIGKLSNLVFYVVEIIIAFISLRFYYSLACKNTQKLIVNQDSIYGMNNYCELLINPRYINNVELLNNKIVVIKTNNQIIKIKYLVHPKEVYEALIK